MRLAVIGFVLFLMIGSCSRKKTNNIRGCSSIWNGKFYDMRNGEATLEILRNGDTQIERSNDGTEYKFNVQWIDSCTYRLTHLSSKKSSTAALPPVIFHITTITNISYKVEGWREGSTFDTYSTEIFRAAH